MNISPGYHLVEIKKGINGEVSKIVEEIYELIDALKQQSKIMSILELSDLTGAIEMYCKKENLEFSTEKNKVGSPTSSIITPECFLNITTMLSTASGKKEKTELVNQLLSGINNFLTLNYVDISMSDLLIMKNITKRAFENGRR